MRKFDRLTLRRRVLPAAALIIVLVLIGASYEANIHSPDEAFSFGIFWPAPTTYVSNSPLPNVYLGINYTGSGLQDFSYVISTNSTILANGTVPINHYSPFEVIVYAPVPSTLVARVMVQGQLVYQQELVLN